MFAADWWTHEMPSKRNVKTARKSRTPKAGSRPKSLVVSTWAKRQQLTPDAITKFHREVDAIKQVHDGQKEVPRTLAPADFYPFLRSRLNQPG